MAEPTVMQNMFKEVRAQLEEVYGKGDMVSGLAQYIVDNWDEWSTADYPENILLLAIWNWFPGGGTAKIATDKVLVVLREVTRDV